MRKSGERGEMKSDKRIEREGEDAERGTKGKTRGGGREVRKEEGGQWEEVAGSVCVAAAAAVAVATIQVIKRVNRMPAGTSPATTSMLGCIHWLVHSLS